MLIPPLLPAVPPMTDRRSATGRSVVAMDTCFPNHEAQGTILLFVDVRDFWFEVQDFAGEGGAMESEVLLPVQDICKLDVEPFIDFHSVWILHFEAEEERRRNRQGRVPRRAGS